MNHIDYINEMERKVVIRDGKKVVVQVARPGYKIVDGKEVKISREELKNREKGAEKSKEKNAIKMKEKRSVRNRKKSMSIRDRKNITEGRDRWNIFQIKRTLRRWSFRNLETNKKYYLKLNDAHVYEQLEKFLREVEATPPTFPKTKGKIDYIRFASDLINGKKGTVFIKSSMFNKIKNTWLIK